MEYSSSAGTPPGFRRGDRHGRVHVGLVRILLMVANEDHMRFIHLFLVGYFIVIVAIGLALYQTGVLARVAPIWIGIGALVAIGVGIMLSVSTGKPTVTEELEK
jgi:hypothetical protein